MKFGVETFLTDQSIGPSELAKAVEERGFESLWLAEHTNIPVKRTTPVPGDGPLPEMHRRTLDPFVALAAAATSTARLLLGTGVCLLAQRDPIITAKESATLDHLSGGRFRLGVGFGWNVEEMANHGVEYSQRRALVREKVLAMQQIWRHDEAHYHGDYVNFDDLWSWPKPKGGFIPVIMGATGGPKTFQSVLEYCDGWMPVHGLSDIETRWPTRRLESSSPRQTQVEIGVVFQVPPSRSIIENYADLGVTRCVIPLKSAPHDEALRALDELATTLHDN